MKQGLIFDMDGLMFDTESIGLRAWTQACSEFGFSMTEEVFFQMVGRDARETKRMLCELYGPSFDYDTVRNRRVELGRDIELNGGLRAKPGLFELLDALEQREIKKAVASSSEATGVLRRLQQSGIESRFQAVVSGSEVSRGKPAPDIFLLAAERLQLAPAECVVLEDSEWGIRGGAAAGMTVVHVPDLRRWGADVEALADYVLPSLVEVRERLCEILRGI